jgi:hypothetical protein
MQSLLEALAIAAEQAGYRAWVSAADETGRVSELFCLVHVHAAGRNYIVHGLFSDELLETLNQPVEHDSMVLMQLTVALPFTVEGIGQQSLLYPASSGRTIKRLR